MSKTVWWTLQLLDFITFPDVFFPSGALWLLENLYKWQGGCKQRKSQQQGVTQPPSHCHQKHPVRCGERIQLLLPMVPPTSFTSKETGHGRPVMHLNLSAIKAISYYWFPWYHLLSVPFSHSCLWINCLQGVVVYCTWNSQDALNSLWFCI